MVGLNISQGMAVFEVLGSHKLWALKGRLEVPLSHVRAVRADPSVRISRPKGWRWPGTYIPGLIRAGTYYQRGQRTFWDVVRPSGCIVVDLVDEPYKQLVVEVAEPEEAVRQIKAALPNPDS